MKINAQLESVAARVGHCCVVAKFRNADGGDLFTARGPLPNDVQPGDLFELDGRFCLSVFMAVSLFLFGSARRYLPTDKRGLLAYAVAITSGMGAAKERAIWEAYGEDWQAHPTLEAVKGVSKSAAANWTATLARIAPQK